MKQIASLSLDLDNQWSYMKTHGDAGWESFPSYLDVIVPRALAFLKERDLDITFFVVGQDAALKKNHKAIASIAEAGHEIGNHSFNHEPWLHLYSKQELITEFDKTETALENVTGQRTIGFRGPGYSLSPTVLEVLVERGYEYDCSTLPTYIGPLARAYYFFKSPEMTDEERAKRKKLFGKFSDGFQSLKPYMWDIGGSDLVEIPVTTMPIVKVPIHASYIIYLSTFSKALARLYWRMTVEMCRLTNTQLSLLLHPLDFLSGDDIAELKFFPGMSLPAAEKVKILSEMLSTLSARFEIVNMRRHADSVRKTVGSPRRSIDTARMAPADAQLEQLS
ncbi:polysaccharide deacetylase family protein [soil metagenome]